MKKAPKLPTIIGIIVLIFGVGAGVALLQFRTIFKIQASPEVIPQDVRISNVSDNSFTVSWVTDKETVGFIKWGVDTGSQEETARAENNTATFTHFVKIESLNPNTQYYFRINSDGEDFDNSGIPYQVKTGPVLTASGAEANVFSGSVVTSTNSPVESAVVFITASGVAPVSTQTSASGSWVISASILRTANLTNLVDIALNDPLLEIFVQAGPQGVASAQIPALAAPETPPIILGQANDFSNRKLTLTGDVPGAELNLPQDSTPSSGFEIEQQATPTATTVTLESVDNNEVVTTAEPEFFGEGPVGTKLAITVESTPQTAQVTVGLNGQWSWTPPQDLETGTHTISIKWTDAQGILRTLTRSFEVQAAEGPAFESTPSASPKPTASASASPSAKPRVSLPSTESGIPDSGTLTPTLILLIMGVGLIGAGFVIWKKV